MTAQAQNNAPRAKTYYGTSAKDLLILAQAKADVAELGNMLAFASKRVDDHKAKHPSRVKRWERTVAGISERIATLGGTNNQPVAATFTQTPLPKATKRKAKAAPDANAILKSLGMTREQALLVLASAG